MFSTAAVERTRENVENEREEPMNELAKVTTSFTIGYVKCRYVTAETLKWNYQEKSSAQFSAYQFQKS